MTDDEPKSLLEQYAIERKQLEIDIAERAEQIRRTEMQRAASRGAELQQPVTKTYDDYVPPRRRAAVVAAPAPAQLTEGWRSFIMQQIDRREQSSMRAMARGVAQTIGMDVVALEKRCEKLEAEVAELRDRLNQERGVKQLRSVPDKGSMIA